MNKTHINNILPQVVVGEGGEWMGLSAGRSSPQWKENQPSICWGGCASSSRICCLPVLLASKGHKELGNTGGNAEQWAGGGCDANKSSYSQVLYPHGLRITELTASWKSASTTKPCRERGLYSTALTRNSCEFCMWLLLPAQMVKSWWTTETPLKVFHRTLLRLLCQLLCPEHWVNLSTPLKEHPHRFGWIQLGLALTQNPGIPPRAKVGLPAQGTNTATSVTPKGVLWRYMTGSLGDSVIGGKFQRYWSRQMTYSKSPSSRAKQ